ncbi:MAG: O-antigen ligase family protein [Geminicoccaceae bacterium]
MISSKPAAYSRTARRAGGASLVGSVVWLVSHLFSFEVLFTGFLYSNAYKQLLPPLPADETVIFAALCIPVAIWVILREGLYIPGINVMVAMIAFLGWIVLSYSWTTSVLLAKENIPLLLVFGTLTVFSGSMVIANSRARAVRFLIVLVIASLGLAIQGNLIYLQHGTFRFYEGLVQRTYLLWGHAVVNGAIIVFAMSIYSRFGSSRQLIALVLFLIMFGFLMIATSRGALLAAIGGCVVPLLVSRPLIASGMLRLQQWQLAALVLVLGGVFYTGHLLISGDTSGTLGRFVKLANEAENPNLVFNANRFAYFSAAVDQWIENPVMGGGINSFAVYFNNREISGTYPHNIVLELLSQYGVIGFLIFMVLLVTAMRQITFDRLRSDPLLLCVFMLFTAQMVGAMFTKELSGHILLFTFLGLLTLREAPDSRVRAISGTRGKGRSGRS